jgi:hypothetical protein
VRYFKKTFVWIIILVGIAGYSFMDFESTRIEEERKDQATRLLPFTPKEVLAITIKKEGNVLELERWEEGWKIIKPIEAKADGEAVEKFLGYVTDSRNDSDYVMDPDPTPERLVEFGLLKPSHYVTLKVGKELTSYTLAFGDRAPSMGVAFALLEGQKAVYRVLAAARAEANKDVYYFRDKSVLRLNPIMLDQLSIRYAESAIRVKLPDSNRWELEKPFKARADHQKVFELLSVFANTEIKEFIAETKNDLRSYGLEKAKIELLFWLSGDSEPTVRLRVGNRSPKKRGYFASMSDRDNIFLLEEEVVSAIPRHANELRSRELFFFEQDRMKRIEIREKKKTVVIVKDRQRGWRRNNVDGEKVDFNLVKEFLGELLDTRIEEFVTDDIKDAGEYGLDSAKIRLLIWPENNAVPINLSIGKMTPAGNRVFARTGSGKEILVLDGRIQTVLRTYL